MKWHLIGLMALLLGIVSLLPAVTSLDSPPPKDAEFTYARIRYQMTPDAIYVREVPWHHDYPFDDFRGPRHLNNLLYQLKKVFPNREVVPLQIKHPMFNTFYQIDTLDVRAPYGPGPVEFLGIEDGHGRLMMVINYNNDLSEFWEWLDRGELPLRDAASSLKFGVNYLMYAMTH